MLSGSPLTYCRRLGQAIQRISLVASDTSIDAPLDPVKLLEGICEGGGDRRQPICCPTHVPGLAGKPCQLDAETEGEQQES